MVFKLDPNFKEKDMPKTIRWYEKFLLIRAKTNNPQKLPADFEYKIRSFIGYVASLQVKYGISDDDTCGGGGGAMY